SPSRRNSMVLLSHVAAPEKDFDSNRTGAPLKTGRGFHRAAAPSLSVCPATRAATGPPSDNSRTSRRVIALKISRPCSLAALSVRATEHPENELPLRRRRKR